MTKIEEILCKKFDVDFENFYDDYGISSKIEDYCHRTYNPDKIMSAMKEYAEWYAQQCLEIAAEKATIYYDVGGYSFIDYQSILNIQLPNHDSI